MEHDYAYAFNLSIRAKADTLPKEFADRVKALLPFCKFGESYRRLLAEDLDAAIRHAGTSQGVFWLSRAEGRATIPANKSLLNGDFVQ